MNGHGRKESGKRAKKKGEVIAGFQDGLCDEFSFPALRSLLVVVSSWRWAIFQTFGEVTHEKATNCRRLVGKCGESVPGWFLD